MEILPILERLGIDRYDPWVWVTTKDRLSPELPRFRVHDGGPRRYVPLDDGLAAASEGYSLEMLGIRLAGGDRVYGLRWEWEGYPTDVRYIRVRWKRSVLSVEYTATKRERDAAIRGCQWGHDAEDREMAWKAMDLIFKGLQRGAPRRKRGPRDPERHRKWERIQQIGYEAAKAEHYAAGGTWDQWRPVWRAWAGTDK